MDLNHGPPGYEPDEHSWLLHPAFVKGKVPASFLNHDLETYFVRWC